MIWSGCWNRRSMCLRPSTPISAACTTSGQCSPHFAEPLKASRTTACCAKKWRLGCATGLGPLTPEGSQEKERYRLVMEGPPNWTSFREFWKMFYDEGAVVVASSYTKVGGLYDGGFRHDPERPLETLAEYCLGCYTNLGLPTRLELLERYIREYRADGFMINSIKSCNSFSVGQLLMLRQLEQSTGVPGGFIESDLVDPRYFSAANIKNRIESYLQMLEQKRAGVNA